MKQPILNTLKIMLVYTVISVIITMTMYGNPFAWQKFLDPLRVVMFIDLVEIPGFNMKVHISESSGNPYYVFNDSLAREITCKIANTILIATAHFLAFKAKTKRKRIKLTILTATLVAGWTAFYIYVAILASAG